MADGQLEDSGRSRKRLASRWRSPCDDTVVCLTSSATVQLLVYLIVGCAWQRLQLREQPCIRCLEAIVNQRFHYDDDGALVYGLRLYVALLSDCFIDDVSNRF